MRTILQLRRDIIIYIQCKCKTNATLIWILWLHLEYVVVQCRIKQFELIICFTEKIKFSKGIFVSLIELQDKLISANCTNYLKQIINYSKSCVWKRIYFKSMEIRLNPLKVKPFYFHSINFYYCIWFMATVKLIFIRQVVSKKLFSYFKMN